jgi:hypothetical protein
MYTSLNKNLNWLSAVLLVTLSIAVLPLRTVAQDQQYDQQDSQQDDPPSRVARLGYMEGSVSLQPAGESEWVQAVANRPMTTGDKLWADKDSRAELQLGSAVIRLAANTGFSFLNLDDRTAQIQLTSGSLNISVRRLDRDDVFEVDTPNQAFSVLQPGSYRVEASEDGNYTVVSVREGEGESTGNGQNFTLHAGQKGTFSGTDSLTADVVQIGGPDQFDNWAYSREHRHHDSSSAQYVSRDVVGYDDLDDNGDWRNDSNYGHVWYPNRVAAGWAPYRDGHWDWIAPWGYTWVDDASWGYAPFHYGRWVTVGGLCAGTGRLHWRRDWWLRRQRWMVSSRSTRSLCALVSRQPGVCESSQHQQHDCQQRHDHERLQHDHHQQDHKHHECHVRQQKCARRGDRSSATHVRECAARRQSCSSSERARYRVRAHEFQSCRGTHA